jgi:FPC/CPF motif-containing protein YcgG
MQVLTASLKEFVQQPEFPCVMAKAMMTKGHFAELVVNDLDPAAAALLSQGPVQSFVDEFRKSPKRLSSLAIRFEHPDLADFDRFEVFFWEFLGNLRALDRAVYQHDPRVDADPLSAKFSFSIKEEAFFILVLHPQSPRKARRFSVPTIVFNAHQQFEDLRAKGLFDRIKAIIRKRDFSLQGSINPMLDDFGENSEIYQYLGRNYQQTSKCPFARFRDWIKPAYALT